MSYLQFFAGDIWTVDGPNVRDFGITFTTRMTVVKLSSGSLWLDSPVPLPPERVREITELGPVRHLIAATSRHFWRLEAWHDLFPEAQMWAARETPFRLRKARLPNPDMLGDVPPPAWAHDLDQLVFRGNPLIEEVIFFHKGSGTVILDDLIQNIPPMPGKHLRNAFFKLAGVAYPGGVPLDGRLSFTNRNLARQALERLLSWDFDKLIIGHGVCLHSNAKQFVERAFRWLAGGTG